MTKSELELRGIKSKEDIAAQDRKQKERSDDRKAKVDFFGHSIKALSSLGKMNDASWYKKLVGGVAANASVPDFNIIGIQDLNLTSDRIPTVPAVVRLRYAPVLGNQRNFLTGQQVINYAAGADPMNIAINRIATQLEMRNSRVLSYSRDTIGRYLFIATDVASDIVRLKSALDVYTKAEATKPFIARQLIRAMGFNYRDFKENISAYKTEYVSLVNEFNESIPLPADLSFIKRQLWLANTIVRDSKSSYCTYLVFSKGIKFAFPTTGTLLSNKPDNYISAKLDTTGETFLLYGNRIKSNMHKLINGATWKPFIRDLRGGTKSEGWVKLLPDITKVSVQVSELDEVREQIHNLDALPLFDSEADKYNGLAYAAFSIGGDANEAVTQNLYNAVPSASSHDDDFKFITPGSMIWSGTAAQVSAISAIYNSIVGGSAFAQGNSYNRVRVLSGHVDALTSDDVLVSTRFKLFHSAYTRDMTPATGDPQMFISCSYTDYSGGSGFEHIFILKPVQYGTEIILGYDIIKDAPDTDYPSINGRTIATDQFVANSDFTSDDIVVFTNEYLLDQNYKDTSNTAISSVFAAVLTLDWYPVTYVLWTNYKRVMGELDHYTTLEASLLGKIEKQCIESEFTLSDTEYLKPLS